MTTYLLDISDFLRHFGDLVLDFPYLWWRRQRSSGAWMNFRYYGNNFVWVWGLGGASGLAGVCAGNGPLTRRTLVSVVTSAKSYMPVLAQAPSVADAALWGTAFHFPIRSDAGACVASTHLTSQRTVTVGPLRASDCQSSPSSSVPISRRPRKDTISSLWAQIVYKIRNQSRGPT